MVPQSKKTYPHGITGRSLLYSDALCLLFAGYIAANDYFHSQGGNHFLLYLSGGGFIYFLIRGLFIVKPPLVQLLRLALVSWGIVEAIYGCLQLYDFAESNNYLYKITGSFRNPGPYSGFLSALSPLALHIALTARHRNKWFRQIIGGIACAYLFLALIILPAGMSRAAWLAAGIGNGIVLAVHYQFRRRIRQFIGRHRKLIVIYSLIACSLLAAVGTGIYLLKKDSADGRLLMWKVTARIIAAHPLTGVGPGHFGGAYGRAQAAYFAAGNATPQEEYVAGSPEYGFNEFLQITAENGIIGLLLFLAVVLLAFRHAIRTRQTGITGSLAALLTFACFSYPFSIMPLNLVFVLLLAMAGEENRGNEKRKMKDEKGRLYTLCILLILLIVSLIRSGKEWKERETAIARWQEEQTYYNMEIYEKTVDQYRSLYKQLKGDPKFLFEYGQCLAKTGQYAESNRILSEGAQLSSDPMYWNIIGKNYQTMQQYPKAEEAFIHASEMVPNRLYPLYLLANLCFSTGQTEKAIRIAQKVIDKTPKVMSSAIEEMKAEMQEKITAARKQL